MKKRKKKIIFLDRDGTINEDYGYLSDPNRFEFLPNTIEGLQVLQNKGYELNIITNQSGIGRGLFTREDYEKVNDYMINELSKNHIFIENIFCCHHRPESNCACRKPKTKLVKGYMKNISKTDCYVIGDKTSDVKFGDMLGIKTVLVLTGYEGNDKKYKVIPNYVVNDILDFAENIL